MSVTACIAVAPGPTQHHGGRWPLFHVETETENDGEPDGDDDIEMEGASASHDPDADTDENAPPPPRRAVGIVQDSPSPAAAGASDALNGDVGAHIILNTTAADDGLADGIMALDQNVNDNLAMGAPSRAIDATPLHSARAQTR